MQELSASSATAPRASEDPHAYHKVEAALRDRERELSQLVDMVPSHIWRLRPHGEPTFFNKRMVDYLGFDVSDLGAEGGLRLEALIASAVYPEDAKAFRDSLRQALETDGVFALRYRLRRADGVYRWMSSRAEPIRDGSGAIAQWYGLCHDIEDQIQAEEAVRRSEQQLRKIVDTVPVAIWSFTSEGKVTYVSPQNKAHLGLEDVNFEDFARVAAEVVHPDDTPHTLAARTAGFTEGRGFSVRYRRRVGHTYRWTEGRAEPLRDEAGNIVHWYAVSMDVDDEVRAQEALRKREHELSQLVDMVPGLLWRLSPEGEPLYFSKRMIEYLGLDVGDYDQPGLSGLSAAIAALVHPDDADRLAKALSHSFATGESFALNYRLRRADGVYRWMSGRGEPLRDQNGQILQWYGLCHDIDDQLRAEEALRESERQLQRLVDALPTQIWAATPDGEPSYLNRRLASYVGLTLEDLTVPDVTRLQAAIQGSVHPDDAAAVGGALAHAFSTGEPFAMKYRQRRADGVYRWINGRGEPLRDSRGQIVQWYGVSFDIDDDVRTQEELRRTQERLAVASQAASLAELSASIAHEVNQPLAAVVANSYASQRWLAADPPNLERARVAVDRVIRDANGAADVVGRIRALFRQNRAGRVAVRLDELIAEARALLSEEALRRRVRIDVVVEAELPQIAIDRIQIQQVLINLMRNGIEAMSGVDHSRVLEVNVRRDGNLVETSVADRGRGIENPERMFEPFFTTKEHGMGMGLAISRTIIEAHGGRLWAEANEPRGARLSFTLPVDVNDE